MSCGGCFDDDLGTVVEPLQNCSPPGGDLIIESEPESYTTPMQDATVRPDEDVEDSPPPTPSATVPFKRNLTPQEDSTALIKAMKAELGGGERRLFIKENQMENVIPAGLNTLKGGRPNNLRTTQFTPLTWLPKSLFFQFKRLANIYFLFIAIVVCFGTWVEKFSPKDWRSKLGPFTLVLFWTACKDLFEDVRRGRDDKKENLQNAKKYNISTGALEDVHWCNVLVGDLLFIPCDAPFPADLVLLKSAENETAFISTVMLDGETSLKERSMPGNMVDLAEIVTDADYKASWNEAQREGLAFAEKLKKGTEIKMGTPTPALSDVRGLVMVEESLVVFPISEENFLPRGCILRNTAFVLAITTYVGTDTKTRLNATQSVLKFSNMQIALNICIKLLLVVIFGIDIYATIMSEIGAFGNDVKKWAWYIMFFRFCIAYYHAVPMSLYVVYEMLKLVLGFQVNVDKTMIADGQNAVARTADLMEEMGQVDFIFSDKTGTLTSNEMVFARGHINGQDVGDFRKPDTGGEPEGLVAMKGILSKGSEAALWFWTCLATCHEVVLEVKAEGSQSDLPTYTGMSPDEVALVTAARDAGVTFVKRNRLQGGINEVEVKDFSGRVSKFEVAVLLQFNSDRKRMSVIVKHGGSAWCITKGADSVMEPLISGGFPEAAKQDILKFSKTGLRVLVIAARKLDKCFLDDWLMDYQKARGTIDDTKEERIQKVVARIEMSLDFVGLTAVEDRLQDGVPEAIATLKEAGSRVWVLTGDKTETAVNIAYSCRLFTDNTKLAYCTNCSTVEEAREGLKRAGLDIDGAPDAGIVIDGGTLLTALSDTECRSLIFSLGMASQACICTRLSPMQKLQLVQLVRAADSKRITLTIGDGANDVPMILGGHVGVGIRGKEGAAAVQVCDVAISQFRFLVPLLLCHGRKSYRRVSVFMCYYLYKNFVLLMADLVWMHWDNFRGNIAFPEYLSIAYNAFFTSWHILFVLGFDRDVPDAVACAHPELYKVGPQRKLFNARIFGTWMMYSVFHGLACWLVPFILIGTKEYRTKTFWISSTAAFTNVVTVTLLKMVIMSENPFHWVTWAPTIGAWLMFVAYLWGIGYTSLGWAVQPTMRDVPENIITKGDVFLTLIIGPAIALFIDVVERIVRRYVFPSELQKVEMKYKNQPPYAPSSKR